MGDFGIYRDLHRHRMLTQERQLLSTRYGYWTPTEILDTPMEKPYREAMEQAQETYELLAADFPEEAQYVVLWPIMCVGTSMLICELFNGYASCALRRRGISVYRYWRKSWQSGSSKLSLFLRAS